MHEVSQTIITFHTFVIKNHLSRLGPHTPTLLGVDYDSHQTSHSIRSVTVPEASLRHNHGGRQGARRDPGYTADAASRAPSEQEPAPRRTMVGQLWRLEAADWTAGRGAGGLIASNLSSTWEKGAEKDGQKGGGSEG